ncbi:MULTISPECIES: 6-phosphogluconolactonase [Pseudanabaena]|uniref:6-phosphogluconolactonase n=2 Tax=Pseudanabaena TaxID=1152 RepID=L8N6V5_9CYAN|nr:MULTISPECIES: 6-phosphogluconolactonase [Pseudanabaena]ELS33963.1 6-phosphogluconolactonase [Pseudanabaena biceps PCC 7429]MDG3493809.1 6-phosphogluconolactonase [Pseudanabaena catenata USMAC16]
MARQVEIWNNRAEIASRALLLCQLAYNEAIAKNGRFTIVAAGGSTPRVLYELLATKEWEWSKVHVFWGDERYVPVSDPQSNEGMTRKAWLDLVAIPASNIHAIPTDPTDPTDPAIAANQYEQHIQEFFGVASGEIPQFDLILLGMGDDGHTASLFPHTKALKVSDRLVTVGEKDGQPRITMTAPLINQAKEIVFMVDGAAKAKALTAVLAPKGDVNLYPSRLITGNTIWLCDRTAKV